MRGVCHPGPLDLAIHLTHSAGYHTGPDNSAQPEPLDITFKGPHVYPDALAHKVL